jgi:RNA polymerase sigma factor (sigma-70 family)
MTTPVNDRYQDDRTVSLLARDQYLREVAWVQAREPLEPQEEHKLLGYLRRARREPENAWLARLALHARERLVEGYQPLVISLAKKVCFSCQGMDLLDVINEGNLGLLQAIASYPEQEVSFRMCASVCIRDALWRARYRGGRWSSIPSDIRNVLSRLRRLRARSSSCGESMSVAEYAARLGVREAWVEEALCVDAFEQMGSLQALVREEDAEDRHEWVSLYEQGPSHEGERQHRLRLIFERVLEQELTPRQREVVMLRYGFGDGVGQGRTQLQVAELLGVSKEAVQKCERIAKHKLSLALMAVESGAHVGCEVRIAYQEASYTVKEAAVVCGVCTQTIRKYIRQGRLPLEVHEGGYARWRIPKQAVHLLMASSESMSADLPDLIA